METFDSYTEWIEHLITHHNNDNILTNRVPPTTFLTSGDDKLVEVIDIRHRLNEYLKITGAYICYGVRPSKRRQGYAIKLQKGIKSFMGFNCL